MNKSVSSTSLQLLILLLVSLFPSLSVAQTANEDSVQACVILLHGLARTDQSMNQIAASLEREGYYVVNEGYDSRRHTVEALSASTLPQRIDQCQQANKSPINFITHSMGGILLRHYLLENEIPSLNRVVMLGPPNQGSEVVDKLKYIPGFYLVNGPAGRQLGTKSSDIPRQLGPANFELGVIAGTKSMNLILSLFLPNPDDGKVSVASTRLQGMCAFLALPAMHPFLMTDEAVIKESLNFLREGQFSSPEAENGLCNEHT